MAQAGYRVLYWDDISDNEPKILNEPTFSKANKLVAGKIIKKKNSADEFVFTITFDNPYYQKLNVIKGLVKVINLFDNSIAFYGRIIDISGNMTTSGRFAQEVTCESTLAYLHDMTMQWTKRVNQGPEEFFRYIIDFYNARVEEHKQFKVGRVTVENRTDLPYLYTTFESSWECVKNRLLDKFGGYIVMRAEDDGNYIDYLSEVGEHKTTPIELGRNIKSANKSVSLADMMTQIVPVGGDDESYQSDEVGTSTDVIRPPIHIGSVNEGKMRLEDAELMEKFGVIRKVVVWSEITSPAILKSRGEQYLKDQRIALANWKVSVVERSLIDDRYEKFELYNYHPIINAPLSGIEELQIIGIDIDITQPHLIDLEIGADSLTLSSFQLQQAAAHESMEKFIANEIAARRLLEQQLAKAQQELLDAQQELQQQIELNGRLTTKESLTTNLQHYQTLLGLENENLAKLESKDKDDELVQLQVSISKTRISGYELLISDIQSRLSILEKEKANE